MGQTLRTIAGTDGGPWASALLNGGLPVAYPSNATFVASVWRGGEEASLFTPAVSWISAAAGTFRFSVAAAQTAALDPGTYRLQILVASGGVTSPAFDGQLEVLDAPGTVSPPIAWCTSADMLRYSAAIRNLQTARDADATGFLGQRAEATAERARQVVERYRPRVGFVRVRQNTMDPILDAMDTIHPSAVPPSKEDVTEALAVVGGIVLEAKLRQIIARDAVALVLARQSPSNREYHAEAETQAAIADGLFRTYCAQVVTQSLVGVGVAVRVDGSTVTTGFDHFLIHRDCTILPAGTSP